MTNKDEDNPCLFLSHIHSLLAYVSDFEHAVNTVTFRKPAECFYSTVALRCGGLPRPRVCDRMCLTRPSHESAGITPGAPQQGNRRLFQQEHADGTHGRRKRKMKQKKRREGERAGGRRRKFMVCPFPRVHHCLLGTGSILIKSSFLWDRFPPCSLPISHTGTVRSPIYLSGALQHHIPVSGGRRERRRE